MESLLRGRGVRPSGSAGPRHPRRRFASGDRAEKAQTFRRRQRGWTRLLRGKRRPCSCHNRAAGAVAPSLWPRRADLRPVLEVDVSDPSTRRLWSVSAVENAGSSADLGSPWLDGISDRHHHRRRLRHRPLLLPAGLQRPASPDPVLRPAGHRRESAGRQGLDRCRRRSGPGKGDQRSSSAGTPSINRSRSSNSLSVCPSALGARSGGGRVRPKGCPRVLRGYAFGSRIAITISPRAERKSGC